MTNFFADNNDIRFLFDHLDLRRCALIMEDDFANVGQHDFAPVDADDAVDNYRRILDTLGALAGDVIAPTAEETDRLGNTLNDDGTVTYSPGIVEALKRLGQADLMGFTLPYEFGGLNCPQLLYTMAIEIISRADASLTNIFGLQGIAETINTFASEEIKKLYLPDLASGVKTAAMVLTEPDAGSDLQAVKVRAYQDEHGCWQLSGVKRFITNGCGDVLLVLARSEPNYTDGRGLSLFVVERGPRVKVRRLEEKLGIHGSPTCELFFDDAPARLVGERRRGLTTYVRSLMNGARVGIAGQSLGIGEAAYRVARSFARTRTHSASAIDAFPAVRELLVNMSIDLQAARALTYLASFYVDLEYGTMKKVESGGVGTKEANRLDEDLRTFKRLNALLIPMCKYYASEMSMRVANDAVAVLGGSGYMRDYSVERHLRDSRITTIYEGTTQLQVVAAIRPVLGGAAAAIVGELLDRKWPEEVKPLVEDLGKCLGFLEEAIAYTNKQGNSEYTDLSSRRIIDMACAVIIGALFCGQAVASDTKRTVVQRWLSTKLPETKMLSQLVCSGNRTVLEDFDALAGRVPSVD